MTGGNAGRSRGCCGGMALVVTAAAYGGPEVLSVVEEPDREPGPGEARIEVRAAGVNPVDVKSYGGAFGTDQDRLPIRLGAEAAGVVTAVGPGASGPAGPVRAGDEVIVYRAPGAYATELVVPGQSVIPKPGSLDWPQAAGLLLTGVTAWHLLAAPILLLAVIFAALGVGTLLSALTVAYRDFTHLTPFMVQVWMYVTPVIFPVSLVPERWKWVLYCNPMTGLVEGFRAAFLGKPFDVSGLAVSFVVASAIFAIGVAYFETVERRFADII